VIVTRPLPEHEIPEYYRLYYHQLFGMLYKLVGSPMAAEDLVHDAFEAFTELVREEAIDQDRSPKALLFTMAQRMAFKYLRRRRLRGNAQARAEAPLHHEDATGSLLDHARLRDALAELPDRERRLLLLFYFADLAAPEIAELLQVSSPVIRKRLQRARAALMDMLESLASSADSD
jgi:RNA polymerase sigma-70 factor (ECF subfamily)